MKNLFKKIKSFFVNIIIKLKNNNLLSPDNVVHYIYSAESLPEPLSLDTESALVKDFQENNDLSAKSKLILHI